ncbi:hypothetical protein AB3S75_023084 [Citrus x aurantiifolia]
MNLESPFTAIAPPVFDGTNYQAWAIRMEAYLDANDMGEVVEQIYEVPPLPDNPTLAQIRNQKEMKQRKLKAKATLFAAVSSTIFFQNNDAQNSQGDLGFFEARIRRK